MFGRVPFWANYSENVFTEACYEVLCHICQSLTQSSWEENAVGGFIFLFAEETSICPWMGLAGSQTALPLILDDKAVEKSGSGRYLKQQRSQRKRKPEPPLAHSLPWQPPAFGSPCNRLWPCSRHLVKEYSRKLLWLLPILFIPSVSSMFADFSCSSSLVLGKILAPWESTRAWPLKKQGQSFTHAHRGHYRVHPTYKDGHEPALLWSLDSLGLVNLSA